MPWKLVPPRKGKTPYWYVRGKYLGIALDNSTGAIEKQAARTIFATWKRRAERGEFSLKHSYDEPAPATFLSAAVAYMQAGGERQYIDRILAKWGERPLADIDQIAIDTLAEQLYPGAPAATKNRQFYTPVSAILKRAGIDKRILRPKGWRGRKSVSWLEPEQAFALFAAADEIDLEFGLFLRLLCYTGMRLSECLGVLVGQTDLARQTIYLPQTKNNDPRNVHLPPELVTALANHPRGLDRHEADRLIRYHAGGRLRDMLKDAMKKAGLSFPRRQCGFHLLRHTWATWMRRYGGIDTSGLVETGAWRDAKSAARYEHLDTTEEARKADKLPWTARGGGRR
jgi:integrase